MPACSGRVVLSLVAGACGNGLIWEDWDKHQVCHPIDYRIPETEKELIGIISAAHEAGEKLKVVGAGHSFSAIALTDGHMVSLDKMNKILSVDGTSVRAQGGIRLYDLNAQLEQLGLSMENLGATCEQSLAGVTSTGTHGTGRLLGNMATVIEAMRIVTANGTVVEVSKDDADPDLFNAARVGLGSLGAISEMTIRTVPLFRLKLTHKTLPLDDLLAQLPTLMDKYERLQWYWTPPNEQSATLITREVTEEPISQSGGCWGGSLLQGPKGNPEDVSASKPCVDISYKALCGSGDQYASRWLYTEMEMFVPAEKVFDAIADFRAFHAEVLPQHNSSIELFTGVRYVAGDDILLSQMSGCDTAVISFIAYGANKDEGGDMVEFARYAQELERLTQERYGGRPHWGKKNWATAKTLLSAYDKAAWAKFMAIRAELDPKGIFLNDYLIARLPLDLAHDVVV